MSTIKLDSQTAKELGQATWRDSKRYLWMLGIVVPLIPIVSALMVWATGSEWWLFFTPIFVYGILPILDKVVGNDPHNPPEAVVKELSQDKYYRYCVYAYIPIQYLILIGGAYAVASGMLGWVGIIGATISVGMIGAVAFNTAHELGHQSDAHEAWLSKIALAQTAYGHFYVEHNRGHHIRVATPEDPASSRFGESYWEFLPRTMKGSLQSAWALEKDRLARLDKSVWSIHNHNLQAWSMTAVLFGALTVWLGWPALLFLVIQAFYASSLFEIINYLEHYGLARQKDPETGRYEPCQPEHSWNSNHLVTNLLLFQLQRHSDHHANPTRSYQALRHYENVPQLPSGYAGMVPLAYITPLWRKIMDKKVLDHYNGDLSKANVQPRLKKKLGLE